MASSKHRARKATDARRYGQELSRQERNKKVARARKKYRRNRQPRGPRRRDWIPDNLDLEQLDEWDPLELGPPETYPDFERIMPRDEGERRRALEAAAFAAHDIEERAEERAKERDAAAAIVPAAGRDADDLAPDPARQTGTVVALSNQLARVEIEGRTLLCSLRGTLSVQESAFTNPLAVGDQVIVLADGADQGVIEEVLPRRTLLARPDVFSPHLRQIVVANVDQLLVVASWRDPLLWFELLDRYLVAAARYELPAVLCINKIDLADDRHEIAAAMACYRALEIPIVLTSAETGAGLESLRTILHTRTSVLAGLSGVGKSSLLTALQPALQLRTSQVSDRKHEGRHTTTQAELLRLDANTVVVDTPGIREFGLSGLPRRQLASYFPEIAQAARACRFRNCAHTDEPGCAVRKAVARQEIAASRYKSYGLILESLPA